MKVRSRRSGQTMVEYIIIVVLIAITLIVLFSKFSKAVGTKVSGATSALDSDVGSEAQSEVDKISPDSVRNLKADGSGLQ
jgi:Flp pilus assembly pilin Flp